MRICVLGAGATGGHFAHRLARAGEEVSVVARGPHLAAIRARGLGLVTDGAPDFVEVATSEDPGELGPQDVVIVGLKATGIPTVAPLLAPLVGSGTLVLFPQNGMPWWYPLGLHETPFPLPDLPIFRAGAELSQLLAPEQVAGGVIYSANELAGPGIVRNTSPERNELSLGPVAGGETEAVGRLRDAFEAAGIGVPGAPDIRLAMWRKLLMNMSGSTLALVTGNRSSIAREDPRLAELYARIMAEGSAIAGAWGYEVDLDPHAILPRLPHHHPSILQDYQQRRPMEVGEIVLAPAAFARAAGVPSPSLDAIAAIVTRLAVDRGLFSA